MGKNSFKKWQSSVQGWVGGTSVQGWAVIERPRMGGVFEVIMLLGKILEILEKRALCCWGQIFSKNMFFSQFPPLLHWTKNLKIKKLRVQSWGVRS